MALDFVAGCLGGCAGVLVGHPLDTVKVRLQTQDASKPLYRGTFHCISSIIKNESVGGLYKGMSSPMCSLAFINAIVFGVQGNMQRSLSEPDSITSHMIAGAAAGTVQSIICSPMELAKTRMQLQGQRAVKTRFLHSTKLLYSYSSPLDCLVKSFRMEGTRGIFRGLGCTVLRDAPGFAACFGAYEVLVRFFSDAENNINTCGLLLAGGLAGTFSWVVSYPMDLVKSRLQADGIFGPRQYNGILDCAVKGYQQEGWRVFTHGLNSTLLRAFPTNAATFFVVSWVIKFYENTNFDFSVDKHVRASLWENKINHIACVDNYL
ncbi:mitochondrial basic amino acids transporter-like isoform X1 [Tachypleus tridentatus]|uniref:mitochondrial basic amino acids transporter-like isoform X1 n=2 Tax=Tachypleus tridentatus TaxID=6853 RepID=UPI003FD3D65C